MNWPKIKTALICLFLVIDIFLACWDAAYRRGQTTVSDETVENTVALLADRGISVSKTLLRKSNPSFKPVTAVNPMADEAAFIGNVLGTGYVKEENRFYTENKEVILEGNSFKITEKGKAVSSLAEAKEWLGSNGFDLTETAETEYMGSYVFRTVYDGFELFGSSVTVTAEEGCAVAKGCLLYAKEAKGERTETKNITSILPLLATENAEGCEIISITLGYMCTVTGETRFTETSTGPVYRIILSDGREFFYGAEK